MTLPILTPTILLASTAAVGAVVANLLARRSGESSPASFGIAVETALAMLFGGLVARAFIWLALSAFAFSPASIPLVGTLFLFWPGIIDAVAWLFTGHAAFDAESVLNWALAFGALVGFWDGFRQIHDWRRRGALTFLLDATWGAAAVSVGLAAHFLNIGWGRPLPSRRIGCHRYDAGVCTAKRFAIALGNVCGNLGGRPDDAHYRHEATHVSQNRMLGPFFLPLYLGWMALLAIPAFAWGVVKRRPFDVVYSWSYCNNPLEEWAYGVGGSRFVWHVWPPQRLAIVAPIVVIFLGSVLVAWIVAAVPR